MKNTSQKKVKYSGYRNKDLAISKWQERLLPLMTRMIIGLTIFFFVASCIQLIFLHMRIGKEPELDILESFSFSLTESEFTFQEMLDASKIKALGMLEANAIKRRYHQANVALMARVWTRYLGFVTGMILAMVGAVFILGKLQESTSKLSAKLQNVEFSLKSASPGIILAALGVVLMVTTIVTHHRIGVTDRAIYTQGLFEESTEKPTLTPRNKMP